ncbi:hypothetical protein BB560_002309 [Smittium megazygosporum]|uniref:Charged multivesicular body protein 6 n=1 Tax=Smittium megazygosporum TaxID=133381 RepID=A0A2T9ZF38_9FUNG|nr:hypothetical protein BB560_002309 [Smittium megazygosporum]
MGSSSSKHSVSDSDKAILELKVQRDKLQKYQNQITKVSQRELQIAKLNLEKGNKERALLALKKKKYQEQLISQTNDQLLNLSKLLQTIEFSLIQKDVINGLKIGNQVLVSLNKETNIQDVENLLMDTQEAIEYQNEISELLSTNLSPESEEAALQDLAELQLQLMNSPPKNKLPEPVINSNIQNQNENNKESNRVSISSEDSKNSEKLADMEPIAI